MVSKHGCSSPKYPFSPLPEFLWPSAYAILCVSYKFSYSKESGRRRNPLHPKPQMLLHPQALLGIVCRGNKFKLFFFLILSVEEQGVPCEHPAGCQVDPLAGANGRRADNVPPLLAPWSPGKPNSPPKDGASGGSCTSSFNKCNYTSGFFSLITGWAFKRKTTKSSRFLLWYLLGDNSIIVENYFKH